MPLDEVRRWLSGIQGSLSQAIVDERRDRRLALLFLDPSALAKYYRREAAGISISKSRARASDLILTIENNYMILGSRQLRNPDRIAPNHRCGNLSWIVAGTQNHDPCTRDVLQ